jgi:hypothetical protein
MRLIRIKNRVFNLSALVEAEFSAVDVNGKGPVCKLRFAVPEDVSQVEGETCIVPYWTKLYGAEVAAFERWLYDNCEFLDAAIALAPAPAQDKDIPF